MSDERKQIVAMSDPTFVIAHPSSLSLIVAMDGNGLIGDEKGLPWRLPADLKRFRKLTTGKPIIMGRKTFEHIGSPLKERLNIVITRQGDFRAVGCVVAHSLEEALQAAKAAAPAEIMIIGGADIFRQALPLAERIYLTIVEGQFTGNTWFPAAPEFRGRVVHEEAFSADEKNQHAHRYLILDRNDGGLPLTAFGMALARNPWS